MYDSNKNSQKIWYILFIGNMIELTSPITTFCYLSVRYDSSSIPPTTYFRDYLEQTICPAKIEQVKDISTDKQVVLWRRPFRPDSSRSFHDRYKQFVKMNNILCDLCLLNVGYHTGLVIFNLLLMKTRGFWHYCIIMFYLHTLLE